VRLLECSRAAALPGSQPSRRYRMLNASRQALFYVKKKEPTRKKRTNKRKRMFSSGLRAKVPGGLEIGRDVRAGAVDRHECAAMILAWSASYELLLLTTHRPLRRRIGRAAAGPLISRRAALVGSSPRRRAASQLWATARTNSSVGGHPRASTRSLAVADDTVLDWSALFRCLNIFLCKVL